MTKAYPIISDFLHKKNIQVQMQDFQKICSKHKSEIEIEER